MAAYHPGVASETCHLNPSDALTPCNNAPGKQTDPSAYCHGPRVVHFGAAVPISIPSVAETKGMSIAEMQTAKSILVEQYIDHLNKYPGGAMAQVAAARGDRSSDEVLETFQKFLGRKPK